MKIKNVRVFPPIAVARLGSSPIPLENYDLQIPDAVSPRRIVPAPTILVDEDGNATESPTSAEVKFRDAEGRIRPVAPFFEVWVETDELEKWQPLTEKLLVACGSSLSALTWNVKVANHKIYRRTDDPKDKISASVRSVSDYRRHELLGECKNFIDNGMLPLGFVQFVRPNAQYPEIRLRFTPAKGKVYGPKTDSPDPIVAGVLYDPDKGGWKGYSEPDSPNNDYEGRRLTNPAEIFAGYDDSDKKTHVSYGYVDDECDGTVEVSLAIDGSMLSSFARVAAGPPTFAPDSKPVRTVADELEQALLGPDAIATPHDIEATKDILRRALETVRLMNTAQMNKAGEDRGVGMARMDILDYGRKSEPIFDPEVADSLAIRARHESVLLSLEKSLPWFARILREYDKVGDLTDSGRRMMPGMMRNADGRYLALTRRQAARIKAVAECIVKNGLPEDTAKQPPHSPEPINLSAQLEYRAKGNPPNSMPDSAISNAYPGLEMDFRNVWRRILDGIVLHESLNFVVAAEGVGMELLKGMLITRIAGVSVTAPVIGPDSTGAVGPLKDTSFGSDQMALEWSNVLTQVIRCYSGAEVECEFQSLDGKDKQTRRLTVRRFFEADSAVIAKDIAEPGALTQSLCAPWQNDYRECACFYWAANRPDFVNVEAAQDGIAIGHNWMQKDRTAETAKTYIADDWLDDRLLTHTDLVRDWEKLLRFVIGNQDEPPVVS